MNYLSIFSAANDATFQSRCQVAMWRAAQDISAESPETDNHVSRKEWSARVLQDKATISCRQLAMQVLRNDTIAVDPTAADDGDIQFQVNSVIDAIIAIG